MKKRILSLLLAAVMVISLMPIVEVPAFAAENETTNANFWATNWVDGWGVPVFMNTDGSELVYYEDCSSTPQTIYPNIALTLTNIADNSDVQTGSTCNGVGVGNLSVGATYAIAQSDTDTNKFTLKNNDMQIKVNADEDFDWISGSDGAIASESWGTIWLFVNAEYEAHTYTLEWPEDVTYYRDLDVNILMNDGTGEKSAVVLKLGGNDDGDNSKTFNHLCYNIDGSEITYSVGGLDISSAYRYLYTFGDVSTNGSTTTIQVLHRPYEVPISYAQGVSFTVEDYNGNVIYNTASASEKVLNLAGATQYTIKYTDVPDGYLTTQQSIGVNQAGELRYNGTLAIADMDSVSSVTISPAEEPLYTITVSDLQNGEVVSDHAKAGAGDTITLTVDPADYYELDKITVTDDDGNEVTVNADNTFTMPASNVTVSATFVASVTPTSAEITLTKYFRNWDDFSDYEFTFNLEAVTPGAPMPADTTATATWDEQTASFGWIEFTEAGIYEYTITEQNGGKDGVAYDTTTHQVEVIVTESNGSLEATTTYDGSNELTITNTFTPASATLEVIKVFNDWSKAESFTFTLEAVTTGAPMPESSTATATETASTASFGEIEFTEAGTYEYQITEVDGRVTGVIYDTNPHTVTVTVTKEEYTNRLSTTVKYDGDLDSLTITNNYSEPTVSAKILTVDAADDRELKGAHLQVIDSDNNVVDEWDSTEEAHEVTELAINATYTCICTVAPDGYAIPDDFNFSVDADGKVTTTGDYDNENEMPLMEFSATAVKVSVVDAADNSKALAGATLQIIDSEGNVVDEWVSDSEAYAVARLTTGEEYTLRVATAASGYLAPEDTTFTLAADGSIDGDKTTAAVSDGVLLVTLTKAHTHTDGTVYPNVWDASITNPEAGSYVLTDSVNASSNISIENEVILCLNGNTLDLGSYSLTVYDGGSLTICDCSADETGTITSKAVNTKHTTIKTTPGSTLVLNSGTIEVTTDSVSEYSHY